MTLVEVLVTVVVGLFVFGAVMNLVVVGAHKQKALDDRTDQLQGARVAEDALVRDLRHASAVTVNSATSVTYTLPGSSATTFACASGTCKRGTRVVITGVTNSDVFAAATATNPSYIQVKLVVTKTGRPAITMNDGVGLRNVTLGQ